MADPCDINESILNFTVLKAALLMLTKLVWIKNFTSNCCNCVQRWNPEQVSLLTSASLSIEMDDGNVLSKSNLK